MALEFFDTHCHLNNSEAFPDPDTSVEEAKANGVTRITIIGLDPASSQLALDIAGRHVGVYAACGWHPSYSDTFTEKGFETIAELLKNPKAVALGETGLDRNTDEVSKEQQLKSLYAHLELVKTVNKPLVFHSRGCETELMDILEKQAPIHGVMHCFGGTLDEAKRAIDLGLFLGFDGPVTFKNSHDLRAMISKLPLEKIVTETDSPYLTPAPHRGTPNHPKYVRLIAQELANVFSLSLEQVADQTTANAKRLYRLT